MRLSPCYTYCGVMPRRLSGRCDSRVSVLRPPSNQREPRRPTTRGGAAFIDVILKN